MAYQQFARYGEWRLLFFLSSRQQAFVKPSQAWFVSAGHQCGHVQGKPNPTRVIPLEVARFFLPAVCARRAMERRDLSSISNSSLPYLAIYEA